MPGLGGPISGHLHALLDWLFMTNQPSARIVTALRKLDELQDATVLLDHGASTLARMRLGRGDGTVVATLLSLGAEKLLKMTYGLTSAADSGTWPGQKVRAYHHGIDRLDADCRDLLRHRLPAGGGYVGTLLAGVESDPLLPPLLRLLVWFPRNRGGFLMPLLG